MVNLIMRTIILFFSLLVMLRLLGKRQIAQLQPYEFAVILIASNLVTIPMSHLDTPLLWGVLPLFVLLALGLLLSVISLKSTFLRGIICSKPRLLIERGKINIDALKAVRYTLNDLLEQLRSNDVFDISEVYYAYLETNGEISVILKKDFRTVEIGDMYKPILQEEIDVALIMDGCVQKENLSYVKKDLLWLKKQVNSGGFKDAREIFLMTFNGRRLYIFGKNNMVKEVNV